MGTVPCAMATREALDWNLNQIDPGQEGVPLRTELGRVSLFLGHPLR